MEEPDAFVPVIFNGNEILEIDSAGRAVIRTSDDLDALLSLRASLRHARAGRGLWLLWTWLLVLSGSTVSIQAESGAGLLVLVFLGIAVVVLVAIIRYVARERRNAAKADRWLTEIDFRLAQLAARPDPKSGP